MKDLLNSLKETVNDRIRNPLIGAFIFAWFVFNWKPIMFFLLSDLKVEDRISKIEDTYASVWNTLFYPFAFAIVYVVLVQYFVWGSTFLARKGIKLRKGIVTKNKEDDLDNQLKIAEKEIELEDVRARHRAKQELNDKIEVLENKLQEQKEEIDHLISLRDKILKDLNNAGDRINALKDLTEAFFDDRYQHSEFPMISREFDNLHVKEKKLFFSINKLIDDRDHNGLSELFMNNVGTESWKVLLDKGFIHTNERDKKAPIGLGPKGELAHGEYLKSRIREYLGQPFDKHLFEGTIFEYPDKRKNDDKT